MKCFNDMTGGELYVPRIPSMKITDLAKAISPNCELVVTGIRPGEKLHEEMISVEDARRTLRLDDRYVILPTLAEWGFVPPMGTPVAEGFAYSSDTNDLWLSETDLRGLLAQLTI